MARQSRSAIFPPLCGQYKAQYCAPYCPALCLAHDASLDGIAMHISANIQQILINVPQDSFVAFIKQGIIGFYITIVR
jgi:hypothetical protein